MTPPFESGEDYIPTRFQLFDMISALSTALDLLDPALGLHQKRTCLIAVKIASSMGINGAAYEQLFGAAIFHDIGAIGLAERLALLDFEETDAHAHGKLGALLLERFPGFKAYAPLVKFHHVHWNQGEGAMHEGEEVPLLSNLIYLADRIEVLAQSKENILGEVKQIVAQIKAESDRKFYPIFVTAFEKIAQKECFWLDIFSHNLDSRLVDMAPFTNIELDLDKMLSFAKFISLVIDSRSHFTATHSAGVAITAETIAAHSGMSRLECTKIRMAGYLHDLGKLAVPSEYIERHDRLSPEEMARVRTHSYITYDILNNLTGLSDVAQWAAFHHERLDGSGYPFHKTAADLPLGARIMAVADVYTALTEHRPYREGLSREGVLEFLAEEVRQGKLDRNVLAILQDNIQEIEEARTRAQLEEGSDLEGFWMMAKQIQKKHQPI